MTTIQILVAIFSSSVLSAGLTSAVNYYLASVNYKNEYYKKLLDNRLEAYQRVHYFLSNLKTLIHDTDENILTPYLLTNGISNLDKVSIDLLIPMKSSIWLSSELADCLTKLSVFLSQVSTEARTYDDPDKALLQIGHSYMDKFSTIREEIETIVKKDFKNLHNIESFLS